MLTPMLQPSARAAADVHIPEMEIDDEILSSDVFYLAASNARLDENSGARYLLRIARGGDCDSESGVTLKIADLTAKYGEDYTVSLYGSHEKAKNPKDNQSLLERIEGSEYTQSELRTEDEYAEMLEDNEALREQTASAMQDAVDYIEQTSGLADVGGTSGDGQPPEGSETSGDGQPPEGSKAPEDGQPPEEEKVPADEPDTETSTDERAAETSGLGEAISTNPLQEARRMYTGVTGEPQRVTSTMDTYQQIQQVANVITNAVVGASLTVDFAEGEREKYIAIDVKNNSKGDGDRYFYLILGEPYGTTTNSAASSCAVTIVDDEKQTPSQIGFAQDAYSASGESVTVEVTRSGALNTIAAAHLTAKGGTAQAGRDFSPVDMDVVFPIGIDRQTVEIPIRTEYISGSADFSLTLQKVDNCTISQSSADVRITGTLGMPRTAQQGGDDGIELFAIQQSNRVSDIVLGNAIDLANPIKKGTSNHFGGKNYYDSNGKWWTTKWKDNSFWYDYSGTVGVNWTIAEEYIKDSAGAKAEYHGADIAGVQVEWEHRGGDANILTGFVGSGSRSFDWSWYNGSCSYSSRASFGRTTRNMFCTFWDPVRFNIYNQANCNDCNYLWIYSIKPIYRPFVVNLADGQPLSFLNADGTRSEWAGANFLALAGASNDTNDQIIRYTRSDKNAITLQQTIGGNISTPYVYLKQINIVADYGASTMVKAFKNDSSSSQTINMTPYWVEQFRNYISFEENNTSDAWKNQNGTFGLRGRLTLKPEFGYKDAKVKINVPANDFGYFRISGENKNISSTQTYTYHRGDILKLSTVMRDQYKLMYEPTGYLVSYKQNESDTQWIKRNVKVTYDENGSGFLDDNERLRYGYYEITPLFQRAGNAITVRVKKSDLSKFDTSYGFFKISVAGEVTVNGTVYNEYIVYREPRYGKIYAISAHLSDSAGETAYLNWTEPGSSRNYGSEVFYHEAGSSKDDNVITLSCVTEKPPSGKNEPAYQSVSGSVYRATYNMQTRQTGVTNSIPAQGAIVSFGGSFSTIGADGSFTTAPFRAMNDYSGSTIKHFIRYVISSNGQDALHEMALPSAQGSYGEVGVSANRGGDDSIRKEKAWIVPQSVGQQLINTENGSVINNIDVYTDNRSQGNNIVIDGDTVVVYAKMREPAYYTKVEADGDGNLTEYPNTPEKVTGIEFIIYDPYTNTQKASYKAEEKDGVFVGELPLSQALPGSRLYLRVTTDRSHGIYSEVQKTFKIKFLWFTIGTWTITVAGQDTEMNHTTYSDVFTGYTFLQKSTEDVPVLQHVDLPIDMKFESLPLLGDTAMQFDLPFVSVGSIKTDTGYRLYIGVGVGQIADKVKDTHMTTYAGDTGAYFKDIFSIKHPVNTFKDGLASSYKEAFKNVPERFDGATSALGAPTWKFDVQVGVYFDFVYTSVSNPNNGAEDTLLFFSGVGGYIGVSAGVKMAWYTIICISGGR